MTLWLVRHAAPVVEPGACYGRTDVGVDAQGTQAAAEALAATLPQAVDLVSSPLRRCTQLAHALCRRRRGLAPRLDARLAEMDFGDWEGRRWNALGPDLLDAWSADFAHHRPGGGESVHQFMQRVAQAYDDVRSAHADTVWITHAGVIRAAQLLARGLRSIEHAEQWPADPLPFGGWTMLQTGAQPTR